MAMALERSCGSRHATACIVQGNKFENGGTKAVVFSYGAQNVDFGYNEMHKTRIDCIQIAGADNLHIHHNWLHLWLRDANDNTHPDAIQSMTIETLNRAQMNNVVIEHNVVDCEDGAYTQSLFNRNEKGIAGSHTAWRIDGNVVINAHHHGVTAAGDTATENNVLVKHANQNDPFNARKFSEFGGYSNSVFQPKVNGAGTRSGNKVFGSLADAVADANHVYQD